MLKRTYIPYLLLILCLAPFQDVQAESCATSSCHPYILQQATVHEPAAGGECESCHQRKNSNHPDDKGPDFILTGTGESLCLDCHDGFEGRYEHGPSASGACTFCHDPHGSDQQSLLRIPLLDLCLGCHEDMASGLQKASFVHSAIEELDCGACHQPHSSEFPKLLTGETSTICFDCHEDIQIKYDRSLNKHEPLYSGSQCANCHQAHYSEYPALLLWEGNEACLHCHGSGKGSDNFRKKLERKVVHAPIEEDGCAACHDPHGSRYGFILKGTYPQSVYTSYDEGIYSLCFQCHSEELLDKNSDETGFRNGTLNLHSVHVARKVKGRSCKACHDVHATDGQSLVTSEGVPFGDWKIPVGFESTDTGGSCMPGCHRAMKYDTQDPVDNSNPDEGKKE